MFRSILRSFSNWGFAQTPGVTSQSPDRKYAPFADCGHGEINVLAMMCSKEHEDDLEAIAKEQCWSYARARTWSEGISAVTAGTASVVVIDRAHLRADWRELLAFLLRPEHHCCVILIDMPERGHLLRDEFLDDGGHAYLQVPLQQADVISAINGAAACWQKIDRAYGH
jgi:AmiR/NasT family two-component response regulator